MESGFVYLQTMTYDYFLQNKQTVNKLLSNSDLELSDEISASSSQIAASFIPMYGHKYIQSDFATGFAGSFGFFMFITSLVPITRLISRISGEKETKIRESMKMMGLSDTPWWLS